MSARRCIVCKVGPREVPDRNTCSMVKRVCKSCHQARLQDDLTRIARIIEAADDADRLL